MKKLVAIIHQLQHGWLQCGELVNITHFGRTRSAAVFVLREAYERVHRPTPLPRQK